MLEFLKESYTLLNNNDLEMTKILVSEKIEEVVGIEDGTFLGMIDTPIGGADTGINVFDSVAIISVCDQDDSDVKRRNYEV